MRKWVLVVCVMVCASVTGVAQAATVRFTGQFAPQSLPEGTAFALNGDQVTSFSALLRPTACASPASWGDDSDAVFRLSLAAGARVRLSGGRFSYSGPAASAFYPSGANGTTYGGQFTVTGTVNPNHTFISATVTLSSAQDPFVSGCSGTYHFIAIRTVPQRRGQPDRHAYRGATIQFDKTGGVIRNLAFTANFRCGAGVDSALVNTAQYGYPAVQTSPTGAFRMTTYVLDEYQSLVVATITGTVTGGRARGRITIKEPPGGFTSIAGDTCSGSQTWTASKPVPPPPPGPSAFFQWAAIRVPINGSYRYYFAVDQLRCTRRANALRVLVTGRSITLPCSRSVALATHPLAPSRTYTVTTQPLELRHGRVIKRGARVTVSLRMPGPDDLWTPIAGLPGAPPT